MQTTMPPRSQEILRGRYIASLGTESEDGSVHHGGVVSIRRGCLYVATSSRSRKAHNVVLRPKASLMVDIRTPGSERGLVAVVRQNDRGENSKEINTRIHRRYMSRQQ